eukprot:COSAG02_NODE_9218_length_2285_cov_2.385178_1_plen_185_part_00
MPSCGTKLQHSTCVVRERCSQPEMLLVGHTHDAVAKAVGHALSQFHYQQQYAVHVAKTETSTVKTEMTRAVETEMKRAQQLEQDVHSLSLTVAELSKQLEAERRDNAAVGRERLALQAQVNRLTRANMSLEDKVHELETAAKKDDSDEDWGCSDAGSGLFAMMTTRVREQQPSQQALRFAEQSP